MQYHTIPCLGEKNNIMIHITGYIYILYGRQVMLLGNLHKSTLESKSG